MNSTSTFNPKVISQMQSASFRVQGLKEVLTFSTDSIIKSNCVLSAYI